VTFAAGKKHLIGGGRFLYDEATGLITDNGPMASGVDAPAVVVKLQDGRALAAGATYGGSVSVSAKVDLFGASAQADCSAGGALFVAARPVFDAAALQCKACNADNGAAAGTLKCPTAGAPACQTGAGNALLGQCTECSASKLTQCTGVKPTCNAAAGACAGCNGGFGSAATQACTTAALPACKADGSCIVANGDFGTAATAPCPTVANPFLKADGSCGKCTTNAECAGAAHGGAICNVTAGSCGVICALDTDCAAGSFCDTAAATHVCTPKKADGAGCAKANECTTNQCNGGNCGPAATTDAGTSGSSGSSGTSGGTDAGDGANVVSGSPGGGDGGGCSTAPSSSSGLSALALAAAVGLAIRSRRRRDD
jgi:MYXO-CTERM domain-containing protein